jgi:stearoyl-CoA desaturase (delta-9 desaturase)
VYILHTWGERLNDKDHSRNNIYINLLQGGEGWHSNHHLTPGKYRMGPFDPCARIIDLIKI